MFESNKAFTRLKKVTPTGCQTLSKMPERYVNGVYPKVLKSGIGPYVTDVDNNSYLDLICSLGAVSLGYQNEAVDEAVKAQLHKGVSFSLPTLIEAEVAEMLCKYIPFTEMWKFGKNGTDGTVMAVRAARAFTGRTKIMTAGYNGCADVFECHGVRNAGIPSSLTEDNTRSNFNSFLDFSRLMTKEYACVLMEPMVQEYPDPRFLETVRELCNRTGTLLIFDEVVWGGRIHGLTASQFFGVTPDLIVLGKAIANGFPLCAVGGKRHIMETFEREDFFASGTFGGECVSLAACLATLPQLAQLIPSTVTKGLMIQEGFNKVFKGFATCEGYPTRLSFKFPTPGHKALFMQEMCFQGILIGHANFIMACLSHSDVDDILMAIEKACWTMKKVWEYPQQHLKGALPITALR